MTLAPCSPWTFDDECCSGLPDDVEDALIERWTAVSTKILFMASGQRYGLCEVVARPCLRSCAGYGYSGPYKHGGSWYNAFCGCIEDCSCTALSEVVLPGPVASVEEVSIDGEPLDPEAYRLDLVGNQYRLLRVDGSVWPSCQDFTAACDEVGAFCVTYMQGIEPDELAIAANSELTCAFVKACIPGCKCPLPTNVASLTRKGVAITFDTANPWIRTLPMVAAFLAAVNPNELISQSSVWSPDVVRVRVTPSESVS